MSYTVAHCAFSPHSNSKVSTCRCDMQLFMLHFSIVQCIPARGKADPFIYQTVRVSILHKYYTSAQNQSTCI